MSLEELKKREEALREREDKFLKRNKWESIINNIIDFVIKIIPIIKDKLSKK